MTALDADLRRRFRVVDTAVTLEQRTLSIAHPANAEELIDARDFERDERLPYWADLWPSARALGEAMLQMPGAGRTLLELGCGAGLVTACASLAGFQVTASDYYEDAMRFARLNAWRNAGRRIETRLIDWRQLPAGLGRYDLVIASDVLYERSYGALVAGAIGAALAPTGTAIVADPGRVARQAFLEALAPADLALRNQRHVPYVDGAISQTIALLEIVRVPFVS